MASILYIFIAILSFILGAAVCYLIMYSRLNAIADKRVNDVTLKITGSIFAKTSLLNDSISERRKALTSIIVYSKEMPQLADDIHKTISSSRSLDWSILELQDELSALRQDIRYCSRMIKNGDALAEQPQRASQKQEREFRGSNPSQTISRLWIDRESYRLTMPIFFAKFGPEQRQAVEESFNTVLKQQRLIAKERAAELRKRPQQQT